MRSLLLSSFAFLGLVALTVPVVAMPAASAGYHRVASASVIPADYYWNHHHYHHRRWDRDHRRWHYYD